MTMNQGYREILPPPELAEAVEVLWIYKNCGGGLLEDRVLPDGGSDIIFDFHSPPRVWFCGVATRPIELLMEPGYSSLGFDFVPAG